MRQIPETDSRCISVKLFGPTLFSCAGQPLYVGLKGTTLELLWYIIINSGHEVRRERVAEQFWPSSDEARQRSALNSALWRIARKLPRHPGLQLHTTVATVCMMIDASISVDSRDLCALVGEGAEPGGTDAKWAQRLEAALEATEEPFMDGIDADWALAERERVSSIRIRGLIALMDWYGNERRYEDALQLGRRILCEDPFRESVQIDMMWLYVLNGQRAQAIRQYQSFATMLRKELGIEPMPETRALLHHIRNDLDCRTKGASQPTYETRRPTGQTRESLSVLLAAVEQSRREIYQTLKGQLG